MSATINIQILRPRRASRSASKLSLRPCSFSIGLCSVNVFFSVNHNERCNMFGTLSLGKRYLSLDAKIRIKFEYDQYHQSFFHIVRQHLAWTSIAVRVFCAATASVKMQSGRCILPGEMPGCKHRRCCQCYCSCHCGAPSLSLTKR